MVYPFFGLPAIVTTLFLGGENWGSDEKPDNEKKPKHLAKAKRVGNRLAYVGRLIEHECKIQDSCPKNGVNLCRREIC